MFETEKLEREGVKRVGSNQLILIQVSETDELERKEAEIAGSNQ